MRNVQKSTVAQYFDLYLSSAAARGVKDKALQTEAFIYKYVMENMVYEEAIWRNGLILTGVLGICFICPSICTMRENTLHVMNP